MSKYFDETFGTEKNTATITPTSSWKATISEEQPQPSHAGNSAATLASKTSLQLSRTLRVLFSEMETLNAFQESHRTLRTRLLRMRSDKGLRSVAVTSSAKGEGKTLTSLSIAISCAQMQDLRVLLVDADMRSFGLSRLVAASAGPGVTDVLSGKGEPPNCVLPTDLPNLHFLRGGSATGSPAELLAGQRWRQLVDWCHKEYSLIIIDTPPVLILTDTDLVVAPCDGVLLIARSLHTQSALLQKSYTHIDPKKLLGVVLNGAEQNRNAYSYTGTGKS